MTLEKIIDIQKSISMQVKHLPNLDVLVHNNNGLVDILIISEAFNNMDMADRRLISNTGTIHLGDGSFLESVRPLLISRKEFQDGQY